MKKLGTKATRWLKILHIILVSLFFGGITSSLVLNFTMEMAAYDQTVELYKNVVTISDYIVRIGAVGTLLIGFIYGLFTNWGFFKHRWVTVKWVLFIIQTFVGINIVDELMMENMALLEMEGSKALSNPVFIDNHTIRQYAVYFQVAVTVFIFGISVLRPWKKKKQK
ncbi:DUF2269 family protein [Cytobacillus oceanisediminis]|uniref:Putative integral membrane protein DUF2269 n=1 Tax=Cytobacillus oceanisediminis TaxID=665099 RepID=A0A562JLD3_9BACI|nr:DUF2269 family protein [Cytobacillus oceanisediminis]TWH84037.1 putative integral membrane protein DUF2269 [Cytobacillus oceanisediminis]